MCLQLYNTSQIELIQFASTLYKSYFTHIEVTMSTPNRGLVNEGSTCYLNSLLQTLFMTAEFRQNIYKHIHPQKQSTINSIPYQLQKLFYVLQTGEKPGVTKGLLKSFQWTEADAFEQHDVQELCRVLFQAIENSHKDGTWVAQLFSGLSATYIDCGKHRRQKEELFMDFSLAIRDLDHQPFTTLEECLKEYFRPQKLSDKIECQQCGERVFVEKGVRLVALPKILTFQLNRFEFNYDTLAREKINTFLYFPSILKMKQFLGKYSDMQATPCPQGLMQEYTRKIEQPITNTTKAKKKTLNRKKSGEVRTSKTSVFFYEEKENREALQKELSKEQQKQKHQQILASLKSEQFTIGKKKTKTKKQQTPPISDSLEDDMLFGSGMAFLAHQTPGQWTSGSFLNKDSDNLNSNQIQKEAQVKFTHKEQAFDSKKDYDSATYALYAVLVHSGGAYGGHYYAYISDGIDWFKFNDSSVVKVPKVQVQQYGGDERSPSGASAYMLFYRDVSTWAQAVPGNVKVPPQLRKMVQQDLKVNGHQHEKPFSSSTQSQGRLKQIKNGLIVKLLYLSPGQVTLQGSSNLSLESLVVEDRFQFTVADLRRKVIELYPQLSFQEESNWRLRRYNRTDETLHQVYDQSFNQISLEQIGFRDTVYVAVEIKLPGEHFQQYDPSKIVIKVNVWRPDIQSLTQKALKPIKMYASQRSSFAEIVQLVREKTGVQRPILIKRSFSQGSPIQVLSNEQPRKLIELRFFSGINLYLEEDPLPREGSRWVKEFQAERYRCLIKYNNPKVNENRDQQLYFDTRKTLRKLKQALSQRIGVDFQEFRIKKSRQAVSQLTSFGRKLCDLKFISNEFLFLQLGKSSRGSIILKQGRATLQQDRIEFILLQETMIELQACIETVGDLAAVLATQHNLEIGHIRIREYKAYQFGQIFQARESLQRVKDKSLIWEQLEEEAPKGMQLYTRVFDMINLGLGPLQQVYVDADATYEELTFLLEQHTGVPSDRMHCWRALSNYVEKEILLDCTWVQTRFIPKKIKEQPLFISNDGDILMQLVFLYHSIKQATEPYHPKIRNTVGASSSFKQGGKENRQVGVRITVVKEIDQQEEGRAQGQDQKQGQETVQTTSPLDATRQQTQDEVQTKKQRQHQLVENKTIEQVQKNQSQLKQQQKQKAAQVAKAQDEEVQVE